MTCTHSRIRCTNCKFFCLDCGAEILPPVEVEHKEPNEPAKKSGKGKAKK